MSSATTSSSTSGAGATLAGAQKGLFWIGWILSGIPLALLLSGSVTAWMAVPQVVAGITSLGYPRSFMPVLGTLEFVCALMFLIPRTAFFGAILMTAYFGGAIATHVRIGDSEWCVPLALGVFVWIGVFLRKPVLRLLVLGFGEMKR